MKPLRCILVLQFAVASALGQPAHRGKPINPRNQAQTLVRNLYSEVVARHPTGTLEYADSQIFAAYLSSGLQRRMNLAKACSADWDRLNPEPQLTADIASEFGLFSGEQGPADLRAFQIEKTQIEKDGSLRVYVKLTSGKSSERPWTWRVAAVVLSEKGHFVVDDVIYVNDSTWDNPEDKPADERLSEYLSAGCNGSRWIGYSLPDQPEALAQSLNEQVVARHPLGIPEGADWKIFAPYLSKALMHKIDAHLGCMADWDRRYGAPHVKPPGLYENGIFSGGNERADPSAFHMDSAEPEKDGSVRVYVTFLWERPPEKPWIYRDADILIRENGRYVLDDVIFLKDENQNQEWRLSEGLVAECDGPHWIGSGNE